MRSGSGRITQREDFRELLRSGGTLVITDGPNKTATLHVDPAGCPGVAEHYFEQKVVQNREENGSYFAVELIEARRRWPELERCHRCG